MIYLTEFFLEWGVFRTNVVEKIKIQILKHFLCWLTFFFSLETSDVYELMWKDIVEPGRPQLTILHMRIACWISKATNTHLLLFHGYYGYAIALQCYVVRILPVLLNVLLASRSQRVCSRSSVDVVGGRLNIMNTSRHSVECMLLRTKSN